MRELMLLAETAGVSAVGVVTQVRRTPHRGTFIGKGKIEELRAEVLRQAADIVIFNDELSSTQHRNLVDLLGCKVLDRTEVILDIFGQHAHTREGKLQVELARLSYELPRLMGRGKMMSRIGGGHRGGVGVRGPGEPQLATDRRHIERHLRLLRAELAEIAVRRNTERAARRKAGLPLVSLVGYTNAGKSTLLNAFAGAEEASVNDRLFETLDPTVRRVRLADNFVALLSDTVGFIQDLPHSLVAAFRATLEEVAQADLLVHVVDASDRYAETQIEAVNDVLAEIGAAGVPAVLALNKWDVAEQIPEAHHLLVALPEALPVSALTGYNLEELKAAVTEVLARRLIPATMHLPYNKLELLQQIRERGHVLNEEYLPEHVYVEAELDEEMLGRLKPYLTAE
jgi:GTP-binding protein HflX